MKKIPPLILLLICLLPVRAQQIITGQVTLTNSTAITNGQTFTLNGNTWAWTNSWVNPCSQIVISNGLYQCTTNFWNTMTLCPQPSINLSWNGSNMVQFSGYPGAAVTITLSGGWASLSYFTNTITPAIAVRVPPSAVGINERSNVENGLDAYLNDNSGTNKVQTNAPQFSLWADWVSSSSQGPASGNTNLLYGFGFPWNSVNGSGTVEGFYLGGNFNSVALANTNDGGSFIIGGESNQVFSQVNYSWPAFIIGGFNNNIGYSPSYVLGYSAVPAFSQIIGGIGNSIFYIEVDGIQSTNLAIFNSLNSSIEGQSETSPMFGTTIVGGNNALAEASWDYLSGFNVSTIYSNDWMWADSGTGSFAATAPNQFLVRASGGIGLNTNNPAGYAVNVGGPVNATAYYVNGQPFTGGGGSFSNVTGGPLQSLYTVTFNPATSPSYNITNLIISGITGGYSYVNGTYTNAQDGWGSGPFSMSLNGNTYTVYGTYTSTTDSACHFSWYTPPSGSYWGLAEDIVGGQQIYGANTTFNLLSPSFNNSWTYYNFPIFTMTPSLNSGSGSSLSTVSWGLGDNWMFNISGTNYFSLSLAQDWEAQVSSLTENHKIFLRANQATTLTFSQTTNQWLWQNRQGLAATAPSSIASNETITIDIAHIGGNTNWLAIWDTTTATSQLESYYVPPVAAVNGATNSYWIDFGHQNQDGGNAIYASLLATNKNTILIGPTNGFPGAEYSIGIQATGTNSIIYFPAFSPINANGLTAVGGYYYLTLTNGNVLRLTVQTNLFYNVLWQTSGQ